MLKAADKTVHIHWFARWFAHRRMATQWTTSVDRTDARNSIEPWLGLTASFSTRHPASSKRRPLPSLTVLLQDRQDELLAVLGESQVLGSPFESGEALLIVVAGDVVEMFIQ